VIPAAPSPQDRDRLLKLLVCLTFKSHLLDKLHKAKNDRRDEFNTDDEAGDDVDVIRSALKEAVAQVLSEPNDCWQDKDPPNWTLLREVSADYCNRLAAGVDAWEGDDRFDWKELVLQVTDVTSADY